MENTSNLTAAAATKSSNAALLSLPEVIVFYHTGKGLYLGKFVYIIVHKWNIKLKNFILLHHLNTKTLFQNKY